ncbi:aldo/keto reductase [Sphingobacterium bambusae]|uniref:Aldo/keto reductase n=1 Tax=Sphingobacterium bambusae TaxID=662858 RepID=A0ABW6BD03_9SPHI|nr:aldo/keto reductase [Sphingobacterium bambusae]WPL48570.1 aldo/keto reductase [Sphingobacterium bambusae]
MNEKTHMVKSLLGLPPVIFGTSALGNLYEEVEYNVKLAIVKECFLHTDSNVVFDSAGKYGAGLSLEMLGRCLDDLQINPSDVLISNKLGWYQVPLTAEEPTFEKGIWKGIKHDAVQKISFDGILDCYYQGNELLGKYEAQLVSVHDPDEYLAQAKNIEEEVKLYEDILEAYRALLQLKASGKVKGVGVGSKDWKVVKRISNDVELDWVMIANSLTLHDHPSELIDFIAELRAKDVTVINSAVFNGGFLIGSDFYNYNFIDRNTSEGQSLYRWRSKFWEICDQFSILPAEACFAFGFAIPGVSSVALNTTKPGKVKRNTDLAKKVIPEAFWLEMKQEGLLTLDFAKF